jgi:hypothetical protein
MYQLVLQGCFTSCYDNQLKKTTTDPIGILLLFEFNLAWNQDMVKQKITRDGTLGSICLFFTQGKDFFTL